jgi:thymidylate kinase
MFVLFEGLDLSGKSTLCRELATSLGWPLRHNSLLPTGTDQAHQAAQEAHRTQTGSIIEVGRLFLGVLASELESYRAEGEPCIQDSTILLRSIAYHTGLGNLELAAEFAALAPRHPKPVLAFLCRPTPEVRLRRLEGRISRGNDTPEDYLVRDDPETFQRMETIIHDLAQRHFGMEILDTSNLEDLDARRCLLERLVSRIRAAA